jgi:hypothetical protein
MRTEVRADSAQKGGADQFSDYVAPSARARRLTANEAKAIIAGRGWTNRALALWWGCRAEHVSRIIHDPERKRHFDDALRGLPDAGDVSR